VWRYLHDPIFSRFEAIPACDGHRQTLIDTAYTALAKHSVAR